MVFYCLRIVIKYFLYTFFLFINGVKVTYIIITHKIFFEINRSCVSFLMFNRFSVLQNYFE